MPRRRKPKCLACRSPHCATLSAELESGVPIRLIAKTYGLSIGSVHRHLHHIEQRGASGATPRQPLRLDAWQQPPPTQERQSALSEQRGDASTVGAQRNQGTSVGPADKPRYPRWFQRMGQRHGNVKDRDVSKTLEDIGKLDAFMKELGAPLQGISLPGAVPGVVVTDGLPGLFEDVLARPWWLDKDEF